MFDNFIRTEILLGSVALERLKSSKVMICGIGGVGSFAAEAIARSAVGNIVLVDYDTVDRTNINRQLIALNSTIGRYKTDIMAQRIQDINDCKIKAYNTKIDWDLLQSEDFMADFESCDYIIEAVDDINAKLLIAKRAYELKLNIISAMGAGNKLNSLNFRVSDIYSTKICPLARIMRSRLKKEGIESLKVVYSEEEPRPLQTEKLEELKSASRSKVIGSISFVPSVMGLILAQEAILDLVKDA